MLASSSRLLSSRTIASSSRRLLWAASSRAQQQQQAQPSVFARNQGAFRWFSSYPPHEVVGMPSLSPTMESGTIASWNVDEGEGFAAGDVICSIETDKATVDFEAQDDGIVAKILKPAESGGEAIACGVPIMVTVEEEGDVAAFKDYTPDEEGTGLQPAAEAPASPPAPVAEPPTPPPVAPAAPAAAAAPTSSGDRVIASPLAHTLAKELGKNIAEITGSGPGGRIIADDVREFVPMAAGVATGAAAPVAAAAVAPPMVGSGYTDYPLSVTAAEVAARLGQAKRNVPHYYLTVDLTMDALLEMRSTLNDERDEDSPLGVYEMILKAAAASMKAVPSVNAAWMESVVRVYDSVDINVVMGDGDALYTPVITDVAKKGLGAIADEMTSLESVLEGGEEDAAAVELPPAFLTHGTFTVMNLGMYGVKSCAPIVREPQSCALALGTMENRIVPSTEEGELYKQSVMMTATLSCDHRVVDGAVGAQWLSAFKSHVENPSTLLL